MNIAVERTLIGPADHVQIDDAGDVQIKAVGPARIIITAEQADLFAGPRYEFHGRFPGLALKDARCFE